MPSPAEPQAPDIFVTETMAELSARQGRTPDAIAIYRRLLDRAAPGDERRTRWTARLAALESGAVAAPPPAPASASPTEVEPRTADAPPGSSSSAQASPSPEVRSPSEGPDGDGPLLRLPLVVTQPVRSGQVVYAQQTDLIVLAPVNPGAQLLADGNIHVYGPLRGWAVAGVRGAYSAQVFCLRLEAELVGVDAAYLISEDLPAAVRGRGARVWLEGGRCRVAPLPVI